MDCLYWVLFLPLCYICYIHRPTAVSSTPTGWWYVLWNHWFEPATHWNPRWTQVPSGGQVREQTGWGKTQPDGCRRRRGEQRVKRSCFQSMKYGKESSSKKSIRNHPFLHITSGSNMFLTMDQEVLSKNRQSHFSYYYLWSEAKFLALFHGYKWEQYWWRPLILIP